MNGSYIKALGKVIIMTEEQFENRKDVYERLLKKGISAIRLAEIAYSDGYEDGWEDCLWDGDDVSERY